MRIKEQEQDTEDLLILKFYAVEIVTPPLSLMKYIFLRIYNLKLSFLYLNVILYLIH